MGLRVNYDSAATRNFLNKCEIYQKPHFLTVYWYSKLRGMLGEHDKDIKPGDDSEWFTNFSCVKFVRESGNFILIL